MTHSLHTIIRMLLTLPLLLALLCSCGSDWDGTWVSQNDPATKIRFSGENVRLIYEDFEMDGTWETDDKGNLIFELTDSSGEKYRISARITGKNDKTLTLTNENGEQEVFKK